MRHAVASAVIGAISGIALGVFGAFDGDGVATANATESSSTPILVELFTSEGCSSCPPADATVAKLTQSARPNARVILLAHHVDYWNQLGWPDPFSSPSSTFRQRAYAPINAGLYTPQAIVDGRFEMVGSKGAAIEDALAKAATVKHARIDLEVTSTQRGVFDIQVRAGALPTTSTDAELSIALVQDHARVQVPRGENAGRTLDHVAIARNVKTLSPIPPTGGSARTTIHLPAIIGAENGSSFSVVAFVQERMSRHILGTSSAQLR